MKTIYIFFFILINLSFNQRLIDLEQPIKPFVSVLSPESIKAFSKQEPQKFLSNTGKNQIFTEKNISSSEDALRNISLTVKCMFVDNFSVYDIRGLSKNTLDDVPYYQATVGGAKLNYNFCYNLKEEGGCKSNSVQVAANPDDNCTKLAGAIGQGNHWQVSNDTITITLNPIDNNDENVVKFVLKCDEDKTHTKRTDPIANESYYRVKKDDGKFETVLYFVTHEACAKADFYVIWKFILDFQWIFGIILIIVGLFEAILGKKLLKPTAFILSCGISIVIIFVFFMQYLLPAGTADWIIWVVLVIAACIGIPLGYFVAKYDDKFVAILAGSLGGYVLGEFLYNLFGNRISLNPTLVNILFIIICIAVLVVLSLFLKKLIIISCTSLIGAYAFIRGISILAGGFPSEATIIDLINAGETDQIKEVLTWKVYLYLVSIVIMTGSSIYIQFKINDDDKFKDNDDEKDEHLTDS